MLELVPGTALGAYVITARIGRGGTGRPTVNAKKCSVAGAARGFMGLMMPVHGRTVVAGGL